MKKANELLDCISNDPKLDNSSDLLASIMETARSNDNIKQLSLLVKNLPSVLDLVSDKIDDWSEDIENDSRIASVLIGLSDVNCTREVTNMSSVLIRANDFSRTKTIAASILLKDSMYGTD